MTATAIRERLYDYIRVADDKKLKAIYMMLEDEIEETIEWWKDKSFVQELDTEYKAWKAGRAKSYTLSETTAAMEQQRKKRKTK
jgi:hypothetical protein